MISKINFTDVNPISNRENSLIKKDLFNTIKNKDFILGKNVKRFENNQEIKIIRNYINDNDYLMIKGSNLTGLNNFSKKLKKGKIN